MQFPPLTLSSIQWVAIGSLGTIGILLFSIYTFKARKLDSEHDREQRLRELEGKSMKEGEFIVTIDTVEFEEKTGNPYRLKRCALQPIDGTVYVTVRIQDIGIPEELWEVEHGQFFLEEQDVSAEYLDSQITSDFTAIVFKLETAEYTDLRVFLSSFTKFFTILQENGDISLHPTSGSKPPFF